jgi:hypothetical protein
MNSGCATRCVLQLWALLTVLLLTGVGSDVGAQTPPAGQAPPRVAPGALSKAHAFLEGPTSCQNCHGPDHRVTPAQCLTCHDPIADRIARKKGVHRGVTDSCVACHVEHQGVEVDLRPLDPTAFDHAAETGFALVGQHAKLAGDCATCHKTRSFITLTPSCSSCHTDQHNGALGSECARCHTPAQWKNVSRAFHKVGKFPLDGRHLAVPCASCHESGVIEGTPARCYDCHWVRRQDDRYRTRLGNQCEQCHRTTAWTAVRWDHGSVTGVQLSPVHRALGCESCHQQQEFASASLGCASCHLGDYQATSRPAHAAAGFSTSCESCHRPSHSSWTQTTFNHGAIFQLAGAHATAACTDCHRSKVYRGTSRDCVSCHRADYDRAANPNHAAAGFPTTCDSCHEAARGSWRGSGFNHNSVFQLTGSHATATCTSCHRNNVYRGTPRDCVSCHRADYDRAANPNHAAAGFPTACDSCHQPTQAGWRGASFNHNSTFQLLGRHSTAACTSCHRNNVYRGTPRDCVACHQANYDRTTNPNHRAAGFPTTCQVCHNASDGSFQQGRFAHTWFPITSGRHSNNACSACHVDPNNYKVFSCLTCHSRSETDSHHGNRPGYRYESQACYACHPTGRGD